MKHSTDHHNIKSNGLVSRPTLGMYMNVVDLIVLNSQCGNVQSVERVMSCVM